MAESTTVTDRIELVEVPATAELETAKSHAMLKGILIAAGVAILTAVTASVVGRRQG